MHEILEPTGVEETERSRFLLTTAVSTLRSPVV